MWWHVGVNMLIAFYLKEKFMLEPCLSYDHCIVHFRLKKTLPHVFHFFFVVSLPTECEYKWGLVTAQYLCSHPQLSL